LPRYSSGKEGKPRALAKFFAWFNRMFGSGTEIYLRLSGAMIRKSVLALVVLAACGLAGLFFGRLLPSSFLPDEDQGYVFISMQLPNAASQGRTAAASRDVEKILSATPAVQYYTSIVGFSC